jgi:hypothetical protein
MNPLNIDAWVSVIRVYLSNRCPKDSLANIDVLRVAGIGDGLTVWKNPETDS